MSVVINYNTYANSTCTLGHDASHVQVSTLSCSFSWDQPDFTLDLGDPLSCCTNNTNLIMLTEEPELLGSCYGRNDEPHGQIMQISFSISASFSFSYTNLDMEGGWQCCQHKVNTLYFSTKQDIVHSSKGNNTDQNIEGNRCETNEVKVWFYARKNPQNN